MPHNLPPASHDAEAPTPAWAPPAGRPSRNPSDWLLVRVLRYAADAVCEADEAPGLADAAPRNSWREMDGILAAVAAALEGAPPARASDAPGPGSRRLVRLLRQEFVLALRASRAHVATSELRRVLAALDAVEDAMAAPAVPAPPPTPALLPEVPEYVAALAHDLRSPLTSILFLVDSLRSGGGGPLTEAQQRQLNLVYVAAFGLCSVANDLLEASRSSEHAGIVGAARPVAFSIAEMLYGVRDIVQPIAEERNVELRIATPEVDGRLGHPSLMSRVLLNLVSNALRETEHGRVEIAVRDVGAEYVEYRVADTGPGIEPGMLARLFEPVRSTPSRPREVLSSAGLGLAICRRLVEAMGGEMRVESAPGRGTTFVCTVLQRPVPAGRAAGERAVAIGADGRVGAPLARPRLEA